MTNRRTYRIRTAAIAAGIVSLVGAGAVFALDPFPPAGGSTDARLVSLERRERAMAERAERVNLAAARRWAIYQRELAVRRAEIARIDGAETAFDGAGSFGAPPVSYVTEDPVTESEES